MLVPLWGFAVSPDLPVAAALLVLVGLCACYAQGLDALVLTEMDPGRAAVSLRPALPQGP